jgi:hypothetical protein
MPLISSRDQVFTKKPSTSIEVVSYISDYKVDVTSATPGRMLVADSSSHIKQRGGESYLWGVPFGP